MRHFRNRRSLVVGLLFVFGCGAAVAPHAGALAAEKTAESANRIVISGASGALAGEAIEALLERGVPLADLILVTRTPEKLASFAERGAAVRAGDFAKPDSLPAAFAGGKQLLLISVNEGDPLTLHSAAISAARRAGIKHVVYTSYTNPIEDNPATIASGHRLTEEVLRKSGMAYTILRNQIYADSLVARGAQAVAAGQIVTNAGRGKWAPVLRADCAAAAAVVLTNPGHEGRTYDITGPDLISERDFAKLLSDVTGKFVRVVDVDDATYTELILKAGAPEPLAKLTASLGVATRELYLNIKSDALEILLGHKPQSVREVLVANKGQLIASAPSAPR